MHAWGLAPTHSKRRQCAREGTVVVVVLEGRKSSTCGYICHAHAHMNTTLYCMYKSHVCLHDLIMHRNGYRFRVLVHGSHCIRLWPVGSWLQ